MDEALERIFSGDPNSWIDGLPDFQRNIINTLFKKYNDYDMVAEAWLSATPAHTVFHGTEPSKKIFFEKLLEEIESFLRCDPKYKNQYLDFVRSETVVKTMMTSSVAVALAPHLGVSATFIAPVIAIVFVSIAKVSINAWLKTREALRSEQDKAE